MSETTPDAKPAAQEASPNVTTTPDAESSPPPQVTLLKATTTQDNKTTELEAGPEVDKVLISDSKPVISDSERVQEVSTGATPVVALEQPAATPVPTSAPETSPVEPITTQEAPPKPVLVSPENLAEPPMSLTADVPKPTETTSVPAVTTTTAAQPKQAQSATDAKMVAEVTSTSKAEASAEPENKLTQKFTEAEWTALREFRVQLPDIFADAYADQPSARETPILLWGVTIDPSNPQSDARVSVILMKFLRARHLGVRDARAMLVNTLRWREEFNVKAAITEDYPKDIFGNLGHIYGCDKARRPVVYSIYGGNQNLKAAFGDVDRFLRWRVALMEKSVAQLDFSEVDQTIQIHDYAGVSISSRDANAKAAAKEASNIFQSHYPELLYKKFFINVPTLLTWIYWAFKPLVSAETLAKMSVVGTGKSTIRKALLPYMDLEEIPSRYGGEAQE